jgi:glutamate/tyrosine decarboxylase-like PLP-dependent enzyme
MVRRHCTLARRVAQRLSAEPGVEVLNDVVLNQVVIGFGSGSNEERSRSTEQVIAALERDNVCLAGGTQWRGRWALRLSIISGPLQEADIDRLAGAIIAAWRSVRPNHEKDRP